MKRVRIEYGIKTNKLLRVYYQDANTTTYYIWEGFITDMKTMKAIVDVCEEISHISTHRGRKICECLVEDERITQVLSQV